MQVVSQQGIKSVDTMVNWVWANTYNSGYVMHSVGIVAGSA